MKRVYHSFRRRAPPKRSAIGRIKAACLAKKDDLMPRNMRRNDEHIAIKRILCGGMNRSGSTWIFNLLRLIVSKSYKSENVYLSWIGDYDPDNPALVHLVKAHVFADAEPFCWDYTISSYRDLRAVAGSMIRMEWIAPKSDTIIPFLTRYIEEEAAWERVANDIVRYESIFDRSIEITSAISRALSIDLDEWELRGISDHLRSMRPSNDNPDGGIDNADPITMLHAGHRSSGSDEDAIGYVPLDVAVDIELNFSDWFKDRNYPNKKDLAINYISSLRRMVMDNVPVIRGEERVVCSRQRLPQGLLKFGFSIEDWGSWTTSPLVLMSLAADPAISDPVLVCEMGAFTPPGSEPIIADGFLNGVKVDSWLWRAGEPEPKVAIGLRCGEICNISFAIHGIRRPVEFGMGTDDRLLGLALRAITVRELVH